MAWPALVLGAVNLVGGLVVGWLRGRRDRTLPHRAAQEAKHEVRAATAPKRWVFGRARVSGVVVRHVDLVDPSIAADYFGRNRNREDVEPLLVRERADRRMFILSYWCWALSEGQVGGVDAVWMDGVRMDLAFRSREQAQDGDFGPAATYEPKEPYWTPFIPLKGPERPGVRPSERPLKWLFYHSDDLADVPRPVWVPALACWLNNGDSAVDGNGVNQSLAVRKLREVYQTGNATEEERADVLAAQGSSLSWVLGRFTQTWAAKNDRPWRRNPNPEFLVRGRGPVHPDFGALLETGNPALVAYWVLRHRMQVPDVLIDDQVLAHAVRTCDEDVVVLSVTENPTAETTARAQAFVSNIEQAVTTAQTAAEVRRAKEGLARLIRRLDEVGGRLGTVEPPEWFDGLDLAEKGRLYGLWRVKQVVEQATGRPWGETTGRRRDAILAQWRKRFTGSDTDDDGLRKRYQVGGVVTSDSDWSAVLDELARSMAGSIEEHGGTWYVRAGSLSVRPEATITAADVVGDRVSQLLEPATADQPTEVRAAVAQDSTGEYEDRQLPPVTRDDANLGDVLADDRPGVVRVAELGYSLAEWTALSATERRAAERTRARVLDMGTLAFVQSPFQAAELQRIALHSTRWDTKTLNLRVRLGDDFEFLRLGKGAVVQVVLDAEGLRGDVVGERVDALRCVVAERPEIDFRAGWVELVLRQQDEDVYGERHGLVFDYHDAPDVLLVGGAYQPVGPLTCQVADFEAEPGGLIAASARWQASSDGGSGAVSFSVAHQVGDPSFMSIDSTTGVLTGRVPAGTRRGTVFRLTVAVRDDVGRTASCTALLTAGTARAPVVRPSSAVVVRGESGSFQARVVCPGDVGADWDDQCAKLNQWTWRLASGPSWVQASASGRVSHVVPSTEPLGKRYVSLEATAPDGRKVTGGVALRIIDPAFSVVGKVFRVRAGVEIKRTPAFTPYNATGAVKEAVPDEVPSQLPPGLTWHENNEISGTVASYTPAGTYDVPFRVQDGALTWAAGTTSFIVTRGEVASCSVSSDWQIPVSGTVRTPIALRGFDGPVTVLLASGPSWMRVVEDGGQWYVEAVTDPGRKAGEASGFSVLVGAGGGVQSARCAGRAEVEPAPTLRLTATGPTARAGQQWAGGGLSASGGVPSYVFSVEDNDIGLVVDSAAGEFGGTARGAAGEYQVRATVTDAAGTSVSQSVTATIEDEPPPPPVCQLDEAVAAPGGTAEASSACVFASGGVLSKGAETSPNGWAVEWTLGAKAQVRGRRWSHLVSFRATAPATAAEGKYVFSLAMAGDNGQPFIARATVTVQPASRPIRCWNTTLKRKRNEAEPGHRLQAAGGDSSVAHYTYSDFVAKPPWMAITNRGVVSFLGQDSPACHHEAEADSPCWSGVVAFTVSRGAVSTTCYLNWSIEKTNDGGGGGRDDDENEDDPGDVEA